MIDTPQNSMQLATLMRRPDVGGALRFVAPPAQSWRDGLSLTPQHMDDAVERLAALVRKFPRGALQGPQKMLYRKAYQQEMGTALRTYAHALRACPEVKGDPQGLEDLARKLGRYQSLRYQSGSAVNGALDLRLMLGALQWYLLRGVLLRVVSRLEDPTTPRAEAELLRTKFAKLLLNKDQLLMDKEQRQQLVAQRQQELLDQTVEVQKQTQVQDTIHALRLNRPVDQQTLETAARNHRAQKQKQVAPNTRKARR